MTYSTNISGVQSAEYLSLINLIIDKYTGYNPTGLEHCGPQASYWKEKWPSLQKRKLKTTVVKKNWKARKHFDSDQSEQEMCQTNICLMRVWLCIFYRQYVKKTQQNALKLFIISLKSTYVFRPAPAIVRVGVIKYQVQCFKKFVVKMKQGAKYLVKMSWC
jgi:hypothetical protein